MLGFTVIGDKALAAKFTAAVAEIKAEKPYWLNDVGLIVEEAIQGNIARQGLIDTGRLIDSGRLFYRTANGISIGFGKGLERPYASWLEFGTLGRNPVIRPRERQALWWIGLEHPVPIVLNHPGNKPYRFVYRGTMEASIPVLMYFFERLKAIFGGM